MNSEKIAHLIATNFYGGPERQIINHAMNLLRRNSIFEPMIISFREVGQENELIAQAEKLGLKYTFIEATGAINLKAIVELACLLKENNISILVSHGFKANVIGRLASIIRGVPMVAVSRGWTAENWKIAIYEKLDRLFLRWATHIVAVSEGQRQKILRCKIRPDKVTVIHNAIELKSIPGPSIRPIRKELEVPENALFICTAGRLSPEKNQISLVEAARDICKQRPDVCFCIFGEGACRATLEAKVEEYGLGKRFHLPGFRKDLLALLHEVDIFTLPSLTEGLPNVILEAFACQKPVVATRVGGTPETVQHGRTGFLYAPHDVSALTSYLLELVDNPQQRALMGKSGFDYVRENFTYDKQTEHYLELYDKLNKIHAY